MVIRGNRQTDGKVQQVLNKDVGWKVSMGQPDVCMEPQNDWKGHCIEDQFEDDLVKDRRVVVIAIPFIAYR